MRVLMITNKDSSNFSLAHIERAFRKKGHKVDLCAPYFSENVLRMFDDEVERRSLDELTTDDMNNYDIIFASVLSFWKLRTRRLLHVNKYIFTYDFLIHGEMVDGGDFNFSPSLNNTMSPYQNELKFCKMGIGEPKYDSLELKDSHESNMLLFIDSGHYPFGIEGKVELAQLLLSICDRFPTYELWIKPRFLPTDEIITHMNSIHLYDIIAEQANGKIPKNMKMLMEHFELEELINKSKTVICMYTTAYISALVAKKGLVIIEGLPNEDAYEVRDKRFMQTRDGMEGSRALVHYKDVLDYLPNGIISPESHIQQELVFTQDVSSKIVEVTEYIYSNFIARGTFPEKKLYEYKNYKQALKARQGANWDTVVSERLENTLRFSLLSVFDKKIKTTLNLNSLVDFVDSVKQDGLINGEVFYNTLKYIRNTVNATIIENHNLMKQDDIDCGILLEACYHQRDFELLKKVSNHDISASLFFNGLIALEEKDQLLAKSYLERYIASTINRPFAKEITDSPIYRKQALSALINMYIQELDFDKLKYYLDLNDKNISNLNQRGMTEFIHAHTREQTYFDVYNNWLKMTDKGLVDQMLDKLNADTIMVYGAGSITENLVMSTRPIAEKVKLLIDQVRNEEYKFGLRLISPEEIVHYPNIKTIVVTVPHVYELIKTNLLNIRKDINIFNISDLCNMNG